MSKLLQRNGDDHPEAARRHLDDASALHGTGRADGTAYLAGYVVECSLKSLILLERSGMPPAGSPPLWKGRDGHNLKKLLASAASIVSFAGAKTARYLGPAVKGLGSAAVAAWEPDMRYRAPSMTLSDAGAWITDAQSVYNETVGQMIKDGVL